MAWRRKTALGAVHVFAPECQWRSSGKHLWTRWPGRMLMPARGCAQAVQALGPAVLPMVLSGR
jgi:hypothetical protein